MIHVTASPGPPGSPGHVLGASKQFGADRSAAAIIGETRNPGSRTRRGATLASVGETRPGTRSACPTCQAAIISRRAGRCTARAPCAMSPISAAMGAYPRRQTVSANLPIPRGRPGNSRAESRTVAARRSRRLGSSLPRHLRIAGLKQSCDLRVANESRAEEARGRCRKRQAAAAAFGRQPQEMHRGLHAVEAALRRPVQGVGWPIKTHQDHPPRPPVRRPRAEPPAIPVTVRSSRGCADSLARQSEQRQANPGAWRRTPLPDRRIPHADERSGDFVGSSALNPNPAMDCGRFRMLAVGSLSACRLDEGVSGNIADHVSGDGFKGRSYDGCD